MDANPEQAGIIARLLGALATFLAVAWGVFTFRKSRADKAEKAIDAKWAAKADDERVTRHKKANDEHIAGLRREIELHRGYFAKVFDQMRDDKAEILGAISALQSQTLHFQTTMATELGKRPTREELAR